MKWLKIFGIQWFYSNYFEGWKKRSIKSKLKSLFSLLFSAILFAIIVIPTSFVGYIVIVVLIKNNNGFYYIITGLLIIGFGLWWKLNIYWFYRTGAYLQESTAIIEEKLSHNQELTPPEKKVLKSMNSGPWMWKVCSRLGIVLIAIGLFLLIIK